MTEPVIELVGGINKTKRFNGLNDAPPDGAERKMLYFLSCEEKEAGSNAAKRNPATDQLAFVGSYVVSGIAHSAFSHRNT